MNNITELHKTAARLLNSRSNTWDADPTVLRLLVYASKYIQLSAKHLDVVKTMINEYYASQDHYKPAPWTVTAERVQAIYSISHKIKQPSQVDIAAVIDNLTRDRAFLPLQNNITYMAALGLLEYLYLHINDLAYNRPTEDDYNETDY